MKQCRFVFVLALIMCISCSGYRNRVIIRPDTAQDIRPESTDPLESWQLIESKNGPDAADIPEWVYCYFNNDSQAAESLDQFTGKYVFIGENRGGNFNALMQWSNGFSAVQDLPRLLAARVERRLVSSATLYPDDEYGQYFENLIKKVTDGEYPDAVKEQTFWIKRKIIPVNDENASDDDIPQQTADLERYEFLVLISIDRGALQKQLSEIMSDIKTTVSPTRDQTAKINRMQQTFFEGF